MAKRKRKRSGYTLVWRAGRNTPIVKRAGTRTRPARKGEGKVVKSRPATASEARQARAGKWVRVDRKGRRPGSKSYGTGSRVRPQFRYRKRRKR